MKRIKTISISICLSLIFSSFVVGSYASNENSHYFETDSCVSVQKVQLIDNNNLKLAPLDTPDTFEQDYQIDSLMQNTNFNEESVEEPSEIEDKIINFEPAKTPCSNNHSDFIEKEWMNKHSFMIL